MPTFNPSIFRYTQATPAQTWSINHGLGGNGSQGIPIVDVFIQDGGQTVKMIPGSVTIIDVNNVEIGFAEARAGFALVIV